MVRLKIKDALQYPAYPRLPLATPPAALRLKQQWLSAWRGMMAAAEAAPAKARMVLVNMVMITMKREAEEEKRGLE